MVNIIYQNDNKIRFTQFDINTTYNLADLRFYIPMDYNMLALYCVIKNTKDEIDAIELKYITSDNKFYKCYIPTNEQPISLDSGKLTLFLFGVCKDKSTIVSEEFNINLNVTNFNTMNQLYVITKLNNDVANYYNKIVELTKHNIEIVSNALSDLNGGV